MILINEFTENPYQTGRIALEDQSKMFAITLWWAPTQMSWYFDIEYDDRNYNGMKLCLGPNILRSYSHSLPFGLMVVSNDLIDPYQITDFITGRVQVYVLNTSEVQQIEGLVYND